MRNATRQPARRAKVFNVPRVIAVDVDGTLLIRGRINRALLKRIEVYRAEGFEIWLWTMNGEPHARRVAERFGIANLFDRIMSKPGFLIDDKGARWITKCRILPLPGGGADA